MTPVCRKTEITSIGDRVFPGSYALLSAFPKAANFLDGERLVAVVTEEAGKGPVNIVTNGLELPRLSELRITGETITINGETLPCDREKIYRSRIEPDSVDAGILRKNLQVLEKTLVELSPPKSLAFLLDPGREADFTSSFEKEFLKRVKDAVSEIFNSNGGAGRCPGLFFNPNVRAGPEPAPIYRGVGPFLNGIKKLKGLGFGLTPSGDDFIAGLLCAFNLLERCRGIDLAGLKEETFRAARGENPLANSFLSLAKNGFFFERLRNLILSLLNGNQDRVSERAKALIAHGETSGSDLGVGFLLTLKAFY